MEDGNEALSDHDMLPTLRDACTPTLVEIGTFGRRTINFDFDLGAGAKTFLPFVCHNLRITRYLVDHKLL